MKRLQVYSMLALLLGVCLTGGLTLKWLLESPEGIRWLLRTVSRHTRVTVTARTVTGGLGSSLRLEGFSARWPDGGLAVTDLRLRCQPLLIPFGSLSVQELSLQGVRLRDSSPPSSTEPEFVWPRISGVPTLFTAWIDHLSMKDISFQKGNQPPVAFPDISAALTWRDSRLGITNLSLATSRGRLAGTVTVGLGSPSLVSALNFEPLRPVAGCTRIELRTRLHSGQTPEQVTGEVIATALAGSRSRYTITGTVGLTGKALNLHGMTLTGQGRRGSLDAAGTILLTGATRLHLHAAGLDLSPELGGKMTLSGTLDLSGESGRYAGRLNLATGGEGWRTTRLAGNLRLNQGGADLSGIDAAVLNGTIRGYLGVDWQNELKVKGTLQGLGLDPARLDPSWNGVVNFDLDSMAAWDGGRLRQGEAHGRLRNSRLRGKALAGEVAAAMKNDDVRIERLFLTGDVFDIHASGTISQRLDLSANIRDLSGLIPKTGGSLALRGWGRYTAGVVSGELSGHGRGLTAEGVCIASASLSALLADKPTRSISAAAELKNMTYHGVRAENASLKADGALDRQQLVLAIRSAGAEIMAKVSGGYAKGSWKGELTSLSGNDLVGPWRLTAPAPLIISSQAVTISPLVLTGLPSERAELVGQLSLKPLRGTLQAGWSGLELARLDKWLVDTRFTGRSSGNLMLAMPTYDRITLQGKATAAGTVTKNKRTYTFHKALLDLNAGERGTTAMLEVRTKEGFSITGRFSSPDPASLAVPPHGELHASWEGLDPALAKRWLPRGLDLQGRLSGELSGKLLPQQHFDLNGTVTLVDGGGRWQAEGRELAAAIRSSGLTWNWRGDSLSGALSLSLADYGEAQGSFQLPLPARFGSVPDPAGQVRATLNGTFREKGALTTLFPGLLQESKGLLEVDLRAGGTWQAPTLAGKIVLAEAGAYLPATGIRLSNVRLAARLEGQSSGKLRLDASAGDRLNLTVETSGTATMEKRTVTIQKAHLDLVAGERGTTAMLEVRTKEGLSVTGRFNSPDPTSLAVPPHGELHASWEGLDPTLARRWLPRGLDLQGRLSGELTGKLLPQQHFDLNGTVTLANGGGRWQAEGQDLAAAVRSSGLTWNWRGDALSGALSLSLANYGEARGSFQLPLPARFGSVPDPVGQVSGTLNGRFREKGVLTALFPGLLQETKGLLDMDLRAGGTWQAPTVTGSLGLSEAGAYLPAAGIRLTDVRMAASLKGTGVQITSFQVTSGTGTLAGTADLSFSGKKLSGYRGSLRGESFQAVHLPELQLMVAPDLTFDGNLKKLSVRGLIRIPKMLVNNQNSSTVIKPSRDVVVKGRGSAASKPASAALDLQLRLLLGDNVVVRSEGLDARLEGGINIRQTDQSKITGSGEISVAKGSYRIYGVNLNIKRGRAFFSGGPVERPTLDILALREIDDIKAGITVTGTPDMPLIKLYSEPSLPDTDILAYVVLGHSLGESGDQTALLMQAASLLASSTQTVGLQERLKQLIKLDTLSFGSSKERSSGYKPIESSLHSTSKKDTENSGIPQTMLQIGKYLTPKLYVSYGRSLFSVSQQLRARYTITKKLEVESKASSEATGGDLFYLIELD